MTDVVPAQRPTKPHDTRICANYAYYLTTNNQYRQQAYCSAIYEDVRELSLIIMMKKYGYSPRIDTETIAHEVASSAVMTAIIRRKQVDSWTNLIRKITHDLSNKWMKAHLYSNHAKNVSLDDYNNSEDPDEVSHATIDVAYHDMDPSVTHMYYAFLQSTAAGVVALLVSIGQDHKSRLLARMALARALGILPAPMLQLLPPYAKFRVQYYAHAIRRKLEPVLSSSKFEEVFF